MKLKCYNKKCRTSSQHHVVQDKNWNKFKIVINFAKQSLVQQQQEQSPGVVENVK